MIELANTDIIILALLLLLFFIIFYNYYNINILLRNKTNKKPELLLYYALWCGHSKHLLNNGWKQFKEHYNNNSNLQKRITVKEISCDDNNELCQENMIRGFPTIMINVNDNMVEYNGNRSHEDIINFINKHV